MPNKDRQNGVPRRKVDRRDTELWHQIRGIPEESKRERKEAEDTAKKLLSRHGFMGRVLGVRTSTG